MKGLCHICLRSNIDVYVIRGETICKQCQKNSEKTK